MNGYGTYLEDELLMGSGYDKEGNPLPGTQAAHRPENYKGNVPVMAKKTGAGAQGVPGQGVSQAPASYAQYPEYRLSDTPATQKTMAIVGDAPQKPKGAGGGMMDMAKSMLPGGGGSAGPSAGVTSGSGGGGTYSSGMPQKPHPTPGAQKWGDALVSEGNSAIDAAPMMGPGAPFVAIAGGVAKTVGTGLQLYAALQEADQAKEEYEVLMDEWEKMKRREEEDYKRELERQRMQDVAYGGAQSAALEDRFSTSYGGYKSGGQY